MKRRLLMLLGGLQAVAALGLIVVGVEMRQSANEIALNLVPSVSELLKTSSELTLQLANDTDRIAGIIETRGPRFFKSTGNTIRSARETSEEFGGNQLPAWQEHVQFTGKQIEDIGSMINYVGEGIDKSIPNGIILQNLDIQLPWEEKLSLKIKPKITMGKPFSEVSKDLRERATGLRNAGKEIPTSWLKTTISMQKTLSDFDESCMDIEKILGELEIEARGIRPSTLSPYIERMKDAEFALKEASETVCEFVKLFDMLLWVLLFLALCFLAGGVAKLVECWPQNFASK